MSHRISRRAFVTHTVAGVAALAPVGLLVACGDDGTNGSGSAEGGSETTACCDGTAGSTSGMTGATESGTGPMPDCVETVDNSLGPFYRAGAPFRSDLAEPDAPGVRLTVSGRVFDLDCDPIADAVLDLWQANDDGNYDNDGSMPELPPDASWRSN